MTRRTCRSCDKPLGSTKKQCHTCGGESIRADRAGTFRDTGIASWWQAIIGRRP